MTVVGGGSPAFTAANPGLGKWLHGAIGLPTVRGAASRASTAPSLTLYRAWRW